MLSGMGHESGGRWVATIAGLAFVAGGVALGSGPYHDRRAFERAGYCTTSAARDDCIARTRMTVLSKSTYTTEDPVPPDNPPPQPPPPQPPPNLGPFRIAPSLGALPLSYTTHYKLTVRTEDGRKHTFSVNAGIYDAAKTGTTGVAEVWHGRIERLRIGAHSDEQWSYFSLSMAWVLAWIGVMLIVDRAPPLADLPLGVTIAGWVLGTIVFAVVHGWGPAIWVVPVIFAGGVLALRVFATATSTGGRY